MSGGEAKVHVFGIRHLSPAGALHVRTLLDEVRPLAVLVEGPSDAGHEIAQIASRGVVPPVAILAYTDQMPVRTLLYPLAAYSPEYQAFLWAAENGARAEFIDLPSDVAVALYALRSQEHRAQPPQEEQGGSPIPEAGADVGQSGDASTAAAANEPALGSAQQRQAYYRTQHSLYERVAELAGEPDYESYWERYFEHQGEGRAYRESVGRLSQEMRLLLEEEEWRSDSIEASVNAVRESYMRRRIREVIDSGVPPERIVVVTGAYHAAALEAPLPPMTDRELRSLPRRSTKLTLMPYSYYKLSSHSGYGAGNQAPAYFELLWDCIRSGEPGRLPALYLSSVAARLREAGTYRSTASVIEGVRLAEALASLRGGSLPTWRELRDAAVVCFGYGELAPVAEALARTDIGTAIGRLPEGVSQTPIQDDLNRQLKRLKLEKYKTAVAADLELDLRENRRVKTAEAAFIDLNRSVFLNRLELLCIGFAQRKRVRQEGATWAEHWVLQWTPEAEIRAVESTLKGETVELAAAYELVERLEGCTELAEASRIIRLACECGLPEAMEAGRQVLQALAVDAGGFAAIAAAAHELSVLIRYGDLRKVETASLEPLLQQLFLRGALLLPDAAVCSEEAAAEMLTGMNELNRAAQEHFELVDDALWLRKLWELASRDDRNPKLSGFAFALLLERNEVTGEQTSREVSRRLSPGIPVDLGAGWFEGLSMRNRYALLSRPDLWQQLDAYIASLDREPFQRSLVFLRRAFGSFDPREKAAVAEMLGMMWGTAGRGIEERLQEPLTDEEREMLHELNQYDFGDL